MGDNARRPTPADVSLETLERFLATRGEHDSWDFKERLDLSKKEDVANITKDIIALSNSGGGHLVIGVEDGSFDPVGMGPGADLDATVLLQAVRRYTTGDVDLACATYDISRVEWIGARRFGVIYVAPFNSAPVVTNSRAAFGERSERVVFGENELLVRRDSATKRADQAAIQRLFDAVTAEEKVTKRSSSLLENLPPREQFTSEFIGRSKELLQLWAWFSDTHRRKWFLTGDGGKGKSALAHEFALQVLARRASDLAAVLWLSAKRRRFQDGQTLQIANPDFTSLDTLLEQIMKFYGDQRADRPIAQLRADCIELLSELPALIIADDIDSLDPNEHDAIEFLEELSSRTASKILFTSRRIEFGRFLHSTQILGLQHAEAREFVTSRVRLSGLDERVFNKKRVDEIVACTDGSPLYIEDLIRLCAVLPADEAVRHWKSKGGDSARRYALQREFEQLSPNAQLIVLSCCVVGEPTTYDEIQSLSGLDEASIFEEIASAQGVFLIGKPRMVDGTERMDVNVNTRQLVLSVFKDSDAMKRVRAAKASISSTAQVSVRARAAIGGYFRQAVASLQRGSPQDAEATILSALKSWPENPDLIGLLATVYIEWKPRAREADARIQFRRAAQLHCRKEEVYLRWHRLEADSNDWASAAAAAEMGLKRARTARLCHLAAFARSTLGRQLQRESQREKALDQLRIAAKLFDQARQILAETTPDQTLAAQVAAWSAINLQALNLGMPAPPHRAT